MEDEGQEKGKEVGEVEKEEVRIWRQKNMMTSN